MNLADVMNEIAARIRQAPSLAGRTYEYEPASITPPAAIVRYPSDYTYDATYGRGTDTMTGSIAVGVGRFTERQSRDLLAKYLNGSGTESIKSLVDGENYSSCDGVRVASVEIEVWTIGGTDYVAAVFALDIVGPGTA